MPVFRYEAARADGHIERGECEADGPRAARALLRERGLAALSVEAVSGQETQARRAGRVAPAALALATRQLASLLGAGLPLDEALAAVADQCETPGQREVWRAVRADVLAGQGLARALEAHPRSFPRLYCATVAAGEQAGSFAAVLDRLAQYLEDGRALRARLLAAALYPAVVTVLAAAIVLFLVTYVVPQVVQVFEHTRQSLPWPTRALLTVSAAARVGGPVLLIVLAAGFPAARALVRRPAVRRLLDGRLLRMPVLGRLMRGLDAARYASTLAMLSEAGVPMLRALAAAEATMSNTVLREAARRTQEAVREGAPLGRALSAGKVFPPVLVRLVDVGEATGRLPAMLQHAARHLSAEVERRATAAAALLEPLLILAMGAVVLAIVTAVMMPIIEINQLVR